MALCDSLGPALRLTELELELGLELSAPLRRLRLALRVCRVLVRVR